MVTDQQIIDAVPEAIRRANQDQRELVERVEGTDLDEPEPEDEN